MSQINKQWVRLAMLLHTQLSFRGTRETFLEMPIERWNRCTTLVRQIRRSQLRSWSLAASELSQELSQAISHLQHELASIQQQVPFQNTVARRATTREIYEDLVALDEEFAELDYDISSCQLSITTEPIVLEGVYLGPFEIRWYWGQTTRNEEPSYRVIAKDPHPAESRENVTHPHVLDERLCEGDGRHAIRRARTEGRLLDFFTLIANVLRTYNPASPFVELALWSGSDCSDCGGLVDEDCSYVCHQCSETICSDCDIRCIDCEESFCSGCLGSCAVCEERVCRDCRKKCQSCHRHICPNCLNEQERCTHCDEDDSDSQDSVQATASAQV